MYCTPPEGHIQGANLYCVVFHCEIRVINLEASLFQCAEGERSQ
jgi:hypothetical protein